MSRNGKIFEKNDLLFYKPPIHPFCRCTIETLKAIFAGTATIDKYNGADYYIKYYQKLPENYISKIEAEKKGWISYSGNLRKILPNATIGGNIYFNFSKCLPQKNGRIWYEADINYTGGFRNEQRIVYSNDGIIFVTYDHYQSFYEII